MDLNKKIKEQDLLIEEINNGVDNLLTENWLSALRLLFKGKKYLPKFLLLKGVKEIGDTLKDKENELKNVEGLSGEDLGAEVMGLKKQIDSLKGELKNIENIEKRQLPFKKITLRFKGKVSLDIDKLKSPEFQRNLLGTMYFTVTNIDEINRYLYLKTNSFPNTIILKLKYQTLNTYQDQKGEVNLIYSRYGNPNINSVSGEKEECYFTVIDIN